MVQFIIILGIILTVGPGHNEGGFEAIKEKGLKAAAVTAWDERDRTKHNDQSRYNG